MCGEKIVPPPACFVTYGSPPRVRGEVLIPLTSFLKTRITPACAGRSCQNPQGGRRSKDHPRVCGEKGSVASMECSLLGSPPRVRGEAEGAGLTAPAGRITPACAGRSVLRRRMCPETEDHPRVCGEKEEGEV